MANSRNRTLTTLAIIQIPFFLFALYSLFVGGPLFTGNGPQHKDYEEAVNQAQKFRHNFINLRKKSHGVYYDTGAFRSFIDTFSRVIQAESAGNIPDSLTWAIGFYWMLSPDSADNNKLKTDFCIAPILVSKNYPKDVIDYLDPTYSVFYKHTNYNHNIRPPQNKVTGGSGDGSAYDAGTLWP
jgi:hypothetical protein